MRVNASVLIGAHGLSPSCRRVVDFAVHHGEHCIRGTRIPVRIVVGSLADGYSADQIIAEYPQLTREDIQSALAYAAEVLHQESMVPLVQ